MMKLAPGTLRLTAMYGLIIAASVICFGASVGNWIDKTRRITGIKSLSFSFLLTLETRSKPNLISFISDLLAARTFLAIQNFCVSLCAVGVSFFLWAYETELDATSKNKNENESFEAISLNYQSDETSKDVHEQVLSLEAAKLVTIIVVIAFSSIARLASSGTVIILQKDWIVVISDNNTDYLASMST